VNRSVVAVGGPPGSGKSTAARRVADELGLDYRSVGEVFRREAASRGLDLEAFGRYAEQHPEVDAELDRSMQALARPGVLLDGRIQGALCRRKGVAVEAIIITASPAERARRLSVRDRQSVEEAARAIAVREASERARYLRYYGIDVDRETADLVVDSTSKGPDEVAAEVVAYLRRRWAADPG
jgi:CMP/dCMP kinase